VKPKFKRPDKDATKYFVGQNDWWDTCFIDGIKESCKIPLLTPDQDPEFLTNGRIQEVH
jgi:hypothetical protein